MKKAFLLFLIISFVQILSAQTLKENESKEDFTSYYDVIDSDINIRAKPNLTSSKVGKITIRSQILVNPALSLTKEKIGNYTGYWLRCYVPSLDVYGYVFSQYFEFDYAERRTSKVPEMIKWQDSIDQKQFKNNSVFITEGNKLKVNLPKYGNDMWGTSEVVVFDAKTGKKIKEIKLNWEERVINLTWNDNKLIIDYDKIKQYPGKYIPTVIEEVF